MVGVPTPWAGEPVLLFAVAVMLSNVNPSGRVSHGWARPLPFHCTNPDIPGVSYTFRSRAMLLNDVSPAGFPSALLSGNGGTSILLADDDGVLRSMCRGILESDGATVIEAPDGEVALRLIQEGPRQVDLVITEVSLPVIGGREVAEVLSVFHPDMPVLGLSADPANADRRLPTLLKPFSAGILIEAARLMRSRAIQMRVSAQEQRTRALQAQHYAAAMSAKPSTARADVDLVAVARALQQGSHLTSRDSGPSLLI